MTFHPSDPTLRVPAAPVWLKVERSGAGRPATNLQPVLRRYRAQPGSVFLRVQTHMIPRARVTFYEDGGSRIGIVPDDHGTHKVDFQGRTGRVVRLPARFSAMVPFGVTEVYLAQEQGMLILDLAQLPQVSA